jgi:hypothetical protein
MQSKRDIIRALFEELYFDFHVYRWIGRSWKPWLKAFGFGAFFFVCAFIFASVVFGLSKEVTNTIIWVVMPIWIAIPVLGFFDHVWIGMRYNKIVSEAKRRYGLDVHWGEIMLYCEDLMLR